MIEAHGDLWEYPADVYVITTNGSVKKDGAAVMGRGVALQAKEKFKGIDVNLGHLLSVWGNEVSPIWHNPIILSFPVKHYWQEKADPFLIMESICQLKRAINVQFGADGHGVVAMPRPGCGNGQLKWEDIKPLVSFLDDRFVVVNNELA